MTLRTQDLQYHILYLIWKKIRGGVGGLGGRAHEGERKFSLHVMCFECGYMFTDSLGKPHAFVANKFSGFGGIQRVDSNVYTAPELIVKHMLRAIIENKGVCGDPATDVKR